MTEANARDGNSLSYTINQTWDSRDTQDNAQIHIKLSKNTLDTTGGILIDIDAPFYNDPVVPAGIPVGPMNGLWDYEVVELFLLSDSSNKYLEAEFSPKGHYLVLELDKQQNVVRNELPLQKFTTSFHGNRWRGSFLIPTDYIPADVNRFNAYAIHKSDPNRVYMSLYPVPKDKYTAPSFHRLDYFKDIDISKLLH